MAGVAAAAVTSLSDANSSYSLSFRTHGEELTDNARNSRNLTRAPFRFVKIARRLSR